MKKEVGEAPQERRVDEPQSAASGQSSMISAMVPSTSKAQSSQQDPLAQASAIEAEEKDKSLLKLLDQQPQEDDKGKDEDEDKDKEQKKQRKMEQKAEKQGDMVSNKAVYVMVKSSLVEQYKESFMELKQWADNRSQTISDTIKLLSAVCDSALTEMQESMIHNDYVSDYFVALCVCQNEYL